jgi:hypothetical protein
LQIAENSNLLELVAEVRVRSVRRGLYMDLRIGNHAASDASIAPAGRADEARRLGLAAAQARARTTGAAGEDRIEISSLTERINDSLSAQSALGAERVRQLAALVQSGRYVPDARRISQALVSRALTGNSQEVA